APPASVLFPPVLAAASLARPGFSPALPGPALPERDAPAPAVLLPELLPLVFGWPALWHLLPIAPRPAPPFQLPYRSACAADNPQPYSESRMLFGRCQGHTVPRPRHARSLLHCAPAASQEVLAPRPLLPGAGRHLCPRCIGRAAAHRTWRLPE